MICKPVNAVRFISTLITLVLVVVLFIVKASSVVGFLLGLATGLSVVLQCRVWSKHLTWTDMKARNELVELNISS